MATKHAMITARALGAIPHFIEAEAGMRGLTKVLAHCSLPAHVIEQREHFIPQKSLMMFIDGAAHLLGEAKLGLLLAPHLTVTDYGIWGEYVLSAPTLGDSLRRATAMIPYHSSGDRLSLLRHGDNMRFRYRFASAGGTAYENVAYCAAGVMTSIARHYLGPAWLPARVEFDFDRPRASDGIEDVFGCPTVFGAKGVAIDIPHRLLATALPPLACRPPVSAVDVVRARGGGPPKALPDIVTELIRQQLADAGPSLDAAARGLDVGSRKLQRELEAFGVTFRGLSNGVRAERARHLLAEPDLSITEISDMLGYAAPAHFARAFAKMTGQTPRAYRQRLHRADA